uniref:2-oxoglutarate and iron dependent oxygenase domain containing 3 n=1 Tax=Hucho hucho TaxID=62062 RepID=A0A4W5JU46_9TELE
VLLLGPNRIREGKTLQNFLKGLHLTWFNIHRERCRWSQVGSEGAGSDGGASILDLHSGALLMGKQFVNIYRYFGEQIMDVFSDEDFRLYREVRGHIQAVVAETFDLDLSLLYLTKPTFF